ncbi:hypothetical protein [Fusibacter sp. 3D3]|uniref:hypothetical protein n=1 Tax=Fusibacter sp. 3D3 TaxID=1048380 RepID=UPI000852FFFA|nr:hypothetical protein [Fusibacter sp. 3D3]GAU75526.1 hypothetical protein F3D3_0117 [Fusibacter sp. 3D3]
MKKEFIKKIAVFALIGAMLMPTMAFADNTANTVTAVPADTTTTERPVKGDLKDRPETDNKYMPRNGERGSQMGDRSLELVILYAPELLDSFEAASDLQKSIRDSIMALQKSKNEVKEADYKALLNTLKSRLEAGTLTRTEAQTQIETFKANDPTDREALKAERDALKTTYGIDRDSQKTLMTTLKTAIADEDEAAIKTALATMITQLQKRAEYDQAYYNLLSAQ